MAVYKGSQKINPIITVSSGGGGDYTIVETSIERSYGIYSWAENYQLGNMHPLDYIPNAPLVLIFDSNGNLLYSFFANSSTGIVNYATHRGVGTKVETEGLSSGYGYLTIYVGTITEEDDYYGETDPIEIYWTAP